MGDIIIKKPKYSGQKLTTQLEPPPEVEPFLNNNGIFVEYDADIHAHESILNIPLISTVLPIAWLTGSNVVVDCLDKEYMESMEKIKIHLKNLYPLIPFKTQILVDQPIENSFTPSDSSRSTALLFSGGVDSTYSLIINLSSKPHLIMYWGVERKPYPDQSDYWNMVVKTYSEFAEKLEVQFSVVKTNVMELLKERSIEHRFHKELFYGSFWVRLQHSLVLLPLTAPLSIERFDKLLIAASGWSYEMPPFNPYPQVAATDEKIYWANIKVKHDGYIERYKKTRKIIELFKEGVPLRVCLNHKDETNLNCNSCEKCFRTIAQITQCNVNPNQYGFKVNQSTWDNMRKHYQKKNQLTWSDLNTQKLIPENIRYDVYGSKNYFEWLREFKPTGKKDVWLFRDLYDFLPFSIAKIIDELYMHLKINIHEEQTPDLPKYKTTFLKKIIAEKNPEWLNEKTPKN